MRDPQGNLLDPNDPYGFETQYRAGGKYTIKTAEELRRSGGPLGPHPGECAELDRVRVRVAVALAEVEERDAYLNDLKREMEWMMDHIYPYAAFIFSSSAENLRGWMEGISLRREVERRALDSQEDESD